jgi:AcrR family transcriptional regulator
MRNIVPVVRNVVLAPRVTDLLESRRAEYAAELTRLLGAGFAVLEQSGTVDFRVCDVVRESGLSNQAFYRHFAGKDEFLLALLSAGTDELAEFLTERMRRAGNAEARVRSWVEGVLAQARNAKAVAATRPFVVHASRLAYLLPEQSDASTRRLQTPLIGALADLGVEDPERLAGHIYHLAMGRMHAWLLASQRPSDEDVASVVEFALRGSRRRRRRGA